MYYASQNLNRAKLIKSGKVNTDNIFWNFKNDYVRIKWFNAVEQPEQFITEDNHIKEIRQKRDTVYEASHWKAQINYETGEK